MHDFIEEYNVDSKICDKFIEYHKNNKEYKDIGRVGGEINVAQKDSTDVLFYNQARVDFMLDFFKALEKSIIHYHKKYFYSPNHNIRTHVTHHIQHYPKGGGFKVIHYERDSLHTTTRQLVYMLYCNTLKKGGTHFPFQEKTLTAKKGKLVIWPSDFTHPHVGVISKTQEKYIVTGWFDIV